MSDGGRVALLSLSDVRNVLSTPDRLTFGTVISGGEKLLFVVEIF